jgi:hypothetical protein
MKLLLLLGLLFALAACQNAGRFEAAPLPVLDTYAVR